MGLPRIVYNGKNIDLPEDVSMRLWDPFVIGARNQSILGAVEFLTQRTDIRGEVTWEMLSSSGSSDSTRRRQFRQLSTWAQEGRLFYVARDRDITVNTTLASDVAAGASTFSVSSASGMTAGMQLVIRDGLRAELVQIDTGGISGTTITPIETLNFGFSAGARVRYVEYWPARLPENAGRIIQENPPLHFNVTLPFVEDVNGL